MKMLAIEKLKKRNLKTNGDDNIEVELLTHVRLDRENITKIENLDVLRAVTHLYLQKNCIEVIENLSCLSSSLRFLTLAQNNISKVEGLQDLQFLAFLDLSENCIKNFHPKELPQSLVFVIFTGNFCCTLPNYRSLLKDNLPNLKSIDNELLILSSNSSSEEDSDDESLTDGDNEISDISLNLLDRSSSRMDEVLDEHHSRLIDISGSQKNSLFKDVEEDIKALLNAIVEAESTALKSFKISSLPAPSNPILATSLPNHTSGSEPNASLRSVRESAELREDILRCISLRKSVSRPFFASVGTTSCGDATLGEYSITPSSRMKQDNRVTSTRSKLLHPSKKGTVASKEKRKVNNSAVVRIPGARPFLKS